MIQEMGTTQSQRDTLFHVYRELRNAAGDLVFPYGSPPVCMGFPAGAFLFGPRPGVSLLLRLPPAPGAPETRSRSTSLLGRPLPDCPNLRPGFYHSGVDRPGPSFSVPLPTGSDKTRAEGDGAGAVRGPEDVGADVQGQRRSVALTPGRFSLHPLSCRDKSVVILCPCRVGTRASFLASASPRYRGFLFNFTVDWTVRDTQGYRHRDVDDPCKLFYTYLN